VAGPALPAAVSAACGNCGRTDYSWSCPCTCDCLPLCEVGALLIQYLSHSTISAEELVKRILDTS
jgi:hypothetical protein